MGMYIAEYVLKLFNSNSGNNLDLLPTIPLNVTVNQNVK